MSFPPASASSGVSSGGSAAPAIATSAPSTAATAGTDGAGAAASALHAQLQQTQQAFGQLQSQFREQSGAYQQQQQTLDRLRQALVGEQGGAAPDPVDAEIGDAERALEYYIAQGFEHEKAGSPIPLTIDTGIRSLQDKIRYLKESRASNAKIAQLEQAVQMAFDTNTRQDLAAREQLGSSLMAAIDTIYGQGDQNLSQKRVMWGAVSQLMNSELTALKESHPAQWDRIRRDPGKLQKLAAYFVEQTIPPRARELLQVEQARRQPLTEGDLWAAYGEAKAIQDPRQRQQLTTKIRQDLLATRFSRGRAAGRQSVSALYQGGRRTG